MKNLRVFSPLLMLLLLGPAALAQAGNPLPDAPQPQDLSSARPELTPPSNAEASGESKLISQARQYPRFPRRPARPSRGRVYASGYSSPPGLSPIGALIGFGAGAAIGASNPADGTVRAHVTLGLIGGTIGAFIGGVIGGAFPHVRRRYPPGPDDDDDEESNLRIPAKKLHPGRLVWARPASPGQSTAVEATAPLSREAAVP
jgi:hypothetical protein